MGRVLSHFGSLCPVLKMRRQPVLSPATLRLLPNVTWETRIPICVLLPGKRISLVIGVPPPAKHIFLVICVPSLEKHISLVICVPLPGKTLSLMICVPQPGKHISLVICVPPRGKHHYRNAPIEKRRP